jgi:acyl-CoA synthetase (AMP-forming)/AMP-acid ligase II
MFPRTLRERVAQHGERTFLHFEGDDITWAEAVDTVARTASLLRQSGVTPGDRVMLAAGNSPTFIYLWFALRWVGATCVPLHVGATPAAVASMVKDAGLNAVVGDEGHRGRVLDAAPSLASRCLLFTDHEALRATVADLPRLEPVETSPYAECNILYTSGTTGAPKGAVLSSEAFLAGGRELAAALEVTAEDRILLALPLFHTNPQVYGVMVALHTGCSIAILRDFKPREFFADAVRTGATGFTYVGTVLSLLLAKTESVPEHQLRFCVGGGAPEGLWRAVETELGVPVHELYGMTETGGWVTATSTKQRRVGSCGIVRPDMECVALDPDDRVLPAGQIGQIAVRPKVPGVIFDGYHARAELTWSKFRNAWFHTGDLGHFDEDGYLYFHGRADDLIRCGGENVAPLDVDTVLGEHPDIVEVAVVGVPDEVMGEEIKAVIVPGPAFAIESLEAFLQDRLPRFAWPRYVEVVHALPKTPTQKIRLGELRALGSDVVDLRSRPGVPS